MSEPDLPDDGLEGTDTAVLNAEEKKIRAILESEDNTGATYEIHRRTNSGKLAYLEGGLPLDDLSNGDYKRKISEMYGAGEYKLRIRRTGGTIGPSVSFEVDRTVKPLAERGLAGTPQGLDLIRLIETMKAEKGGGDRDLFLGIMQMQAQQAQQAQAQMTALMTALISRPAPAPPPFPEKLLEIVLEKSNASEPMDFDKLFSFAERVSRLSRPPEPEEDSGLDRVFGAIGGLLQKIPALNPPPPPEPVRVNAPPPETDEDAAEDAEERRAVEALCAQADKATPAGMVASWMRANMTAAQVARVTALLSPADFFADLSADYPVMLPHEAWFNALREAWLKS